MKKLQQLFAFFSSDGEATTSSASGKKEGKTTKKKGSINAETTPGGLFEYYGQILLRRPEDIRTGRK